MRTIFFIIALLTAVSAVAIIAIMGMPYLTQIKVAEIRTSEKKLYQELTPDSELIRYDLVDPEMAPKDMHDQVMYGYNIVLYTNKILPQYVDNRLSCANCHFAGGNTMGGKRGGISLVGVVRIYPRYAKRLRKTIDIEERINNCFERSLNGKPLPRNSKEMKAIIAYLEWISSSIPEHHHYPWLGLKLLKTQHKPNSEEGMKIYQRNCASCHMINGQGTVHNPPVWGPHAFNDGAGMADLPKLSSFIFYNMPYDNPFLTEKEAQDVAAYLVNQRRPKFLKETKANHSSNFDSLTPSKNLSN